MCVINRKKEEESFEVDKIQDRIQRLSEGLSSLIDPKSIAQQVVNEMSPKITTAEIDVLAAQICAYKAASHPDFSKLGARIAISSLHKNTSDNIEDVAERLYSRKNKLGKPEALLSKEVYRFIMENKEQLNKEIDYSRDLEYDYFGFKTLERSYLLRVDDEIVERPQHLLMRVSCTIHTGNLDDAIQTYHLLSQKFFTHATLTLMNAGKTDGYLASCFLINMQKDSIDGIFSTLKQCALASPAGGIGLSIHGIRAFGSYIRGTQGRSNGIVPMLRVCNGILPCVDQTGGKRKGPFAIYLEPWHADIFEFLDLKKNHGKEEARARDLFYGLWTPDLFMRRVEADEDWTLMCPDECPGLSDLWGAEFDALYERYEREKRGKETVKAQKLWFKIYESQVETGTPYMMYKDSCNRKSNQQNLGTIKCSSPCTEIVQYTSVDEVAACNLASLALPKFVNLETQEFNHEELHRITKVVAKNLNRVIDKNFYPIEEAKRSNFRHRPIGIGVQGLADVFMLLRFPFESQEAKSLNKLIFETIYHAAVEASVELAQIDGPYETFKGSPASRGLFQFDLWNDERITKGLPLIELCGKWDWETLRREMQTYGLRNSLLVALIPTSSVAQILGNNECFEAYTSNIYSRRVVSGEFIVVNPHLLRDLIDRGIWSESMKHKLLAANGSVQEISEIPNDLKELYKTVWEIKQRTIIDLAADRAPFVDQSQSLNIHLVEPTYAKFSSMHFYGWKLGLKTGQYYLRTQAAADAIKFTVDQGKVGEGLSEVSVKI